MRTLIRKLMMTILILLLVGNAAAGAVAAQSEQPSNGNLPNLSSVSVFAGSGDYDDWDGAALEASFREPQGMVVLKDGTVLVADRENHLIRRIAAGQVSTYTGIALETGADGIPVGGMHDGNRETAVFNSPTGMDADAEGNIYIADTRNHAIRKVSQDGSVTTIAGNGILGMQDGAGSEARFYHPQDVAVAADGSLYVADTLNHSIRKIAPDGHVTTLNAPSERAVEVVAGHAVPAGDYADGILATSKFNEPSSIAIDNKGNLYVSDTGNHVIRYIDLSAGTVSTAAGLATGVQPAYAKDALYAEGGYADGASGEARFYSPKGIALTNEQGLVIADSMNHAIRYLADGQVRTIAGVPGQFGSVDGINGHNLLHQPSDVAVLPNGDLLIADSYNNSIRTLEYYELPGNLPNIGQVNVVLDNQVIQFDVQPEIVKERTMVPVRALSEQMGYKVGFDSSEKGIELTKGDVRIKLQIGQPAIYIENTATGEQQRYEMDAAPYAKAGRSYVPLRFFSEAFGMDVEWNQQTRTVILREIAEEFDKQPLGNRHWRAATLEQIQGVVWITQAGGSMAYRASNGITLHHGDRISTEFNSSAILKTADRKDQISIGEHANLYIAALRQESTVKHTSIMLWSGDVGASVTSLVDAKDTFKVLTPAAVNDVRGTNFFVAVDPATGRTSLAVASGVVQVRGNGTGNGSEQPSQAVYPTQQVSIYPGIGASEPNVIDPADLVSQVSPAIIEAMLRQKQQIDQENAELLESLKKGASDPGSGDTPSNSSQEELERAKRNMENLVANIARQAAEQGKMDTDRLQDLIDEINRQTDKRLDLNNVSPLTMTEQEKLKLEQQKKMEEERKKKQEEQNKLKLELERKQADLLEKLKAEKERLEQENKAAMEKAKEKATEQLKQQLSDAERLRFEQQQRALEQQQRQQELAQRPQPPAPSRPAPDPTPTNAAPRVINKLDDMVVDFEEQFEIELAEVFEDPDDDELTLTVSTSNPDIADVEISDGVLFITPADFGSTVITVTASDGKGGTASESFEFGFYPLIYNLRAEIWSDGIYLIFGLDEFECEDLCYEVYMDGELPVITSDSSMEFNELTPGTEYKFRVVARNIAGEIVAFAEDSFTTYPVDGPAD